MSESFVLTILEGSITGAGLVLAIYALILPISRRLFEKRSRELINEITNARMLSQGLSTATTPDELESLRESIKSIQVTGGMPSYMGAGVGLSFALFIISCMMSFWWLISYNFTFMDQNLSAIFGLTIIVFGGLGIIVIKDIYGVLEQEYKAHKKIEFDLKKNNGDGDKEKKVNLKFTKES